MTDAEIMAGVLDLVDPRVDYDTASKALNPLLDANADAVGFFLLAAARILASSVLRNAGADPEALMADLRKLSVHAL